MYYNYDCISSMTSPSQQSMVNENQAQEARADTDQKVNDIEPKRPIMKIDIMMLMMKMLHRKMMKY